MHDKTNHIHTIRAGMPRFDVDDRPRRPITLADDDLISTRQLEILKNFVNFQNRTRNHPHMCCDATRDEWDALVEMLNV